MNYEDIPQIALSIRQPWAWAILHAGKDIENRTARTSLRGPIAIHAARTIDDQAREDCDAIMDLARRVVDVRRDHCWLPPIPDDLALGAIVGVVDIVDVVEASPSLWFFGRYGYVLANPVALPEPIPARGMPGFFNWKRGIS